MRIVVEVLRLEGLGIGGHDYGRVGWEWGGRMGGATRQEGVVHQGNVREGGRGGCRVRDGGEMEL